MSLGWFTDLADAIAYFETERLVTTAWDAFTDDALKSKAVTNAYNRIYYDPKYNLPTYATATAAELITLKKVNGEMAYYLAQHMEDEDRRKGIQAQGVVEAGIVKEKYDKDMLDKLPLPPIVEGLLAEFVTGGFYAVGIERVEDDDIDEGEGT